jgi:hypothetical protein
MTTREALLSILHLFTVLSFFTAAVFMTAAYCFSHVRLKIADFFLSDDYSCLFAAVIFFAVAFLLLGGFYLLEKGRFLVIRMGVLVDVKVVKAVVQNCLDQIEGSKIHLLDVDLDNRSKLKMSIMIEDGDEKMREELLKNAEKALCSLLKDRFGYSKSFDVKIFRK